MQKFGTLHGDNTWWLEKQKYLKVTATGSTADINEPNKRACKNEIERSHDSRTR